jgi:hypothetical protein
MQVNTTKYVILSRMANIKLLTKPNVLSTDKQDSWTLLAECKLAQSLCKQEPGHQPCSCPSKWSSDTRLH